MDENDCLPCQQCSLRSSAYCQNPRPQDRLVLQWRCKKDKPCLPEKPILLSTYKLFRQDNLLLYTFLGTSIDTTLFYLQ